MPTHQKAQKHNREREKKKKKSKSEKATERASERK
jgi:hypothetical protein